MKDIFITDNEAKESLLEIYGQVIQMVNELPKELSTLLSKLYGDVSSKLEMSATLVSEKCKLVVAGNTNHGLKIFTYIFFICYHLRIMHIIPCSFVQIREKCSNESIVILL